MDRRMIGVLNVSLGFICKKDPKSPCSRWVILTNQPRPEVEIRPHQNVPQVDNCHKSTSVNTGNITSVSRHSVTILISFGSLDKGSNLWEEQLNLSASCLLTQLQPANPSAAITNMELLSRGIRRSWRCCLKDSSVCYVTLVCILPF